MEEKKPVKISLSTVLLIVALVIIIFLCIYIFRLSSKIDTLSDNKNSISNSLNETDTLESKSGTTISTNTDTLPQLPGKFSDIKSIIKEYRDNHNVKNYKDFEYDIDSDGIIDKITLKHIINENEEEYSSDREYYVLEYNGKSIYDHWYGMGSVGIVDLDNTDKYLEIWVYDDGPSDDPVYSFYRKVGSQIIELGYFEMERGFLCDGKGKVLAADRNSPWVNPQVFNCYYTIENNGFKKNSLEFFYDKDYEYTSKEGFFTTSLENLKMFEKDKSNVIGTGNANDLVTLGKKHNINKLDSNTKFKIVEFVETDIEEYSAINLKVTLSDGTIGYLIHPYGIFHIYD